MSELPPVSIAAVEMHDELSADALSRVDCVLGAASEWPSPLISHRLSDEFQADWKEEVGHWLGTAERHGYLDALVGRVKRAQRATGETEINPNDVEHRILVQELAPASVAHYFLHTGWKFEAWEPKLTGKGDVDSSLRTPSGDLALFQVKGSDVPGRIVNGKIVDGEHDDRVITGLWKAAKQLPQTSTDVRIVAMCANRGWPISSVVHNVVGELIGRTVQRGDVVTLPQENRGAFWSPEWKHVSGVILLDLLRGVEECRYSCTVLLNPTAQVPALPDWFPRGRVVHLVGDEFRWIPRAPFSHFLPSGTRLT